MSVELKKDDDDGIEKLLKDSKEEHGLNATIINRLISKEIEPCIADKLLEISHDINNKYFIDINIENDKFILDEYQKSKLTVVAWGNHGKFLERSKHVLKLIGPVYHFGLTKQGEPKHPLYLKANLKPVLLKK